jgi:hypothetical protein
MAKYQVVSMPGDGIGKVVLPEAVRVLDAVGFDAEYIPADIGWEFWIKEGNPLPERTIELLSKYKLGLFGAITSKPKAEAQKELSAELQGKGYSYFSPIVGMRQRFNLDVCIRPCRSFAGNPLNFIVAADAEGGFDEPAGRRRDLSSEHRGPVLRHRVEQPAASRVVDALITATRSGRPLPSVPAAGLGDVGAPVYAHAVVGAFCEAAFRLCPQDTAISRSRSAKSPTCSARRLA